MQSTRFKLQLLALLPINYIAYMSSIRSSRILFSCRITRLFQLSYLTDLLQNIFVMVKWFGIHVNESRKHLIKMFGIILLAAHFSACVCSYGFPPISSEKTAALLDDMESD